MGLEVDLNYSVLLRSCELLIYSSLCFYQLLKAINFSPSSAHYFVEETYFFLPSMCLSPSFSSPKKGLAKLSYPNRWEVEGDFERFSLLMATPTQHEGILKWWFAEILVANRSS